MTTMRRSVQQTVARLARRVLVERAQAVGTVAARPDAPAALAAVIEQRLANPGLDAEELDAWCQAALSAGFGSLAVSARRLAPVAELLIGSKIYLNALCCVADLTAQASPSALEEIASHGAHEVEVALDSELCANLTGLEETLHGWRERCEQHNISLNIQLPGELIGHEECAALCSLMVRVGIDGLGLPIHVGVAEQLGQLRPLTGQDMGLHVIGKIESLELARHLLAAGATRLSTSAGLSLLESSRQPSGEPYQNP